MKQKQTIRKMENSKKRMVLFIFLISLLCVSASTAQIERQNALVFEINYSHETNEFTLVSILMTRAYISSASESDTGHLFTLEDASGKIIYSHKQQLSKTIIYETFGETPNAAIIPLPEQTISIIMPANPKEKYFVIKDLLGNEKLRTDISSYVSGLKIIRQEIIQEIETSNSDNSSDEETTLELPEESKQKKTTFTVMLAILAAMILLAVFMLYKAEQATKK